MRCNLTNFLLKLSITKVLNSSLDNPSQKIEQCLFNLESSPLILSPVDVPKPDYVFRDVVELERGTHPVLSRNSRIPCSRDCTLDVFDSPIDFHRKVQWSFDVDAFIGTRWNRAQSAR